MLLGQGDTLELRTTHCTGGVAKLTLSVELERALSHEEVEEGREEEGRREDKKQKEEDDKKQRESAEAEQLRSSSSSFSSSQEEQDTYRSQLYNMF